MTPRLGSTVRPLPGAAQAAQPGADAHWGLWYDKYFDGWPAGCNGGQGPDPKAKHRWLQQTGQGIGGSRWARQGLAEYQARYARLVAHCGGWGAVARTIQPLVCGMGSLHPVGATLTWHPTLGLPYIPGSSLKGALRAWLNERHAPDVDRWLGAAGRCGTVDLLDAIPWERVAMDTEVLTPHYAPYYLHGEPPADWYDPVPVAYLTVAPRQGFLLAVVPRTPGAADEAERVGKELLAALAANGVGAKVAVAHGRLEEDSQATAQWRAVVAQCGRARGAETATRGDVSDAAADPILAAFEREGAFARPDAWLGQQMAEWIRRMEDRSGDEAVAIARALRHWYRECRPDQWRKPNAKNRDRVQRIRRVLQAAGEEGP